MNQLFAYLIILSPFLYSCKSLDSKKKNSTIQLIYRGDVKLEMDSVTKPETYYGFYDTTNKEKSPIQIVNGATNTIQSYNLKGIKSSSINLKIDGPNSVGKIKGFYKYNKDSIFIINHFLRQVFLLSSNGRITLKYNIPINDKNKYNPYPINESGVEMFFFKGSLFIPALAGAVDPYLKDNDIYLKGKIGIIVNIKNRSTSFAIPYPNSDLLLQKRFPFQATTPYCIPNRIQNEIIYSFGCDPFIYQYSTNGKLINKHLLETSKYDKQIKPMPEMSTLSNPTRHYLHYLNNLYYGKVYHDPYHNLYYRFVKLPLEEEFTEKNLRNGDIFKQKWSLIIADSNFRNLGEIDLQEGLWGGLLLVSKEGIYIQKWVDDEDHMHFKHYSVKKLQM